MFKLVVKFCLSARAGSVYHTMYKLAEQNHVEVLEGVLFIRTSEKEFYAHPQGEWLGFKLEEIKDA